MKKTYICASDEYMGCGLEMWEESHVSWRELLLSLLDFDGSEDWWYDTAAYIAEHGRQRDLNEVPDEELEKLFNDANGDGQPFIQVWCFEEHRQVLGGKA
jgi:hypothetical protein